MSKINVTDINATGTPSSTTVLRGDGSWGPGGSGGGGGSGALTLIDTQTLSANQATVTFASIPQTYQDLVVVMSSGGDGGGGGNQFINCEMNGDTGNNYNYAQWDRFENDTGFNQYPGKISAIVDNGDFWPSSVEIFNYTSTIAFKHWLARTSLYGGGNFQSRFIDGYWSSTSPLTDLALFSSGQNFTAGSTFQLYGRGGSGGSGGGAGDLIKSYVATGTETYFDFIVPTGYTDLDLSFTGNTNGGSEARVSYYLNGDFTAANYECGTWNHYGFGNSNGSYLADVSGVSGQVGASITRFNAYQSNQIKTSNTSFSVWVPSDYFPAIATSYWNNTAPITSIRVFAPAGTFTAGTTVSLIGLGGDAGGGGGGGSGPVLLQTVNIVAGQVNIDLTAFDNSKYLHYMIEAYDVYGTGSGEYLNMFCSTDGGVTFDTSAAYAYAYLTLGSGGYSANTTGNNDTKMRFGGGLNNTYGSAWTHKLYNAGSSKLKQFMLNTSCLSNDGNDYSQAGAARYLTTSPVTALRITQEGTDTFTGGTVRLIGVT